MEKEISNYGPIELDQRAYRFFPSGNKSIKNRKINKNRGRQERSKIFFLWPNYS